MRHSDNSLNLILHFRNCYLQLPVVSQINLFYPENVNRHEEKAYLLWVSLILSFPLSHKTHEKVESERERDVCESKLWERKRTLQRENCERGIEGETEERNGWGP